MMARVFADSTKPIEHWQLHGGSVWTTCCEYCAADATELALNGIKREDIAKMARVYGVARFLGVTVEDMKAFAAQRAGLWTRDDPESPGKENPHQSGDGGEQ